MGYRKLKSGRWRVVARLWNGGNVLHKQATIDGTRETAKALLEKLKDELRTGKPTSSLTLIKLSTFNDVIKLYVEGRQFTASHKRKVDVISRELGEIPLNVFPDRFKEYLILRRKTPSRTTGGERSPADNNRIVEIVRAAFNAACAAEKLDRNPITRARFPRMKEIPRDVVISEIEQKRLLNVIDGNAEHLSAIVRFAFQVPCRRSELVGMRREDLDIFNNVIRVRNGTTKNDRGQWKPIPPDMVEYFRNIPAGCEWLFYRQDRDGTYNNLGDFKRAWKRCKRLAGITGLRFHDTRHISATALVDNGIPEQVVQTVANWKTNMLKNYYHREPKKALELVRFGTKHDSVMIASKAGNE